MANHTVFKSQPPNLLERGMKRASISSEFEASKGIHYPLGGFCSFGNLWFGEKRLKNCSASYCRSVQTTASKTLVIAWDGEVSTSGFTTVRSWRDRREKKGAFIR